jgi:hypothetical protein
MRLYGRSHVFDDAAPSVTHNLAAISNAQFRALFLFVSVALQEWLWFDLDANGNPIATQLSDEEWEQLDGLLGILVDADQS